MLEDLAFAVTLGPSVVHLEAAHSGGATRAILPVRTVRVQRVLWLARCVHFLLRFLRHFFWVLRAAKNEV